MPMNQKDIEGTIYKYKNVHVIYLFNTFSCSDTKGPSIMLEINLVLSKKKK